MENPPANASEVSALIEWSMNWKGEPCSPYLIFLDLIGYTQEEYGMSFSQGADFSRVLGYMELDYLGDALKEYATNPSDVLDFIKAIDEADQRE
jgi:hypothetical protein